MVGLDDLIELGRIAQSRRKNPPRNNPQEFSDWLARIGHPDEGFVLSSIIVGQRFELPEPISLAPGDICKIHQGVTQEDYDYHWPDGPKVTEADEVFILNEENEVVLRGVPSLESRE